MKVIDLLNKMANGEEIPSPIYHNNLYYDFEDGDYFNQKTRNWLFNDSDIDTILNDEVQIIREVKKIEKHNTGLGNGEWHEESVRKDILENKNIEDYLIRVMKEVDAVKFKTFEIIDKINKGEE